MADLTVYAESLISAVARAFYDDECIVLIDILISQKYLRDDDMAQRLNLPPKKLRSTIQFLQEEHLVRVEEVDDLAQGGSQTTKFYYLDYNRAVHSIRLRLYMLRKQLETAELRARSNSYYLCPGYKDRRCNGRYTEEEAQQRVDVRTGLFICQECSTAYENDPNPPAIETYTLRLIDNTKDLRIAMDNLRRLSVQLSAKFVGNQQIRPGIYDLLQKVRSGNNGGKGGGGTSTTGSSNNAPITSNFPSENFALGIGSKRLAGTGRTAGIRAKKLEQQGVAESAAQAKTYLVNGGKLLNSTNRNDDVELLFLKNALGHEIQFTVERGSGARAQLLASKQQRRQKQRYHRKLMDAAAIRVGANLPYHIRVEESRKRNATNAANKKMKESKHGRTTTGPSRIGAPLHFLHDNIGRIGQEDHIEKQTNAVSTDTAATGQISDARIQDQSSDSVLVDDEEMHRQQLSDEARMVAFQSQYQVEVDRQAKLLQLETIESSSTFLGSPRHSIMSDDDTVIPWEDGELT
jgi:transcription initiation factor IIE alpha subunit